MRRMQISHGLRTALSSVLATGLATGLVAGSTLLLSGAGGAGCSFYLPERPGCSGDGGCKPTDAGTTPDMAKDVNDPSGMGPYRVATLTSPTPPAGISSVMLLGPSDDGSALSQKEATYPLVLIAPPEYTNSSAMRSYADQLASHGFLVALYDVANQMNHATYRDSAKALLDSFVTNAATQHIDTQRLGLVGYQLSGKISASLAANDNRIGALFLIDPVDVSTASGPIDGVNEIARVALAGNAAVALLGGQITTTGSPPCVQSPGTKSFQNFYDAARMPAVAITFGGANLGDFIDNYYDNYCTKDSTAPKTRTQDLSKKYMTAYFQWSLKARARSREYLLGADFATDQQNSMVTRQSK